MVLKILTQTNFQHTNKIEMEIENSKLFSVSQI